MIVRFAGTQTLDDLLRFEGKAELIAGKIIEIVSGTSKHGVPAGQIHGSLWAYAYRTHAGQAVVDGVSFAPPGLPPTGRQSFSPDAAFILGELHNAEELIPTAPTFAVEVRGNDAYGPAADDEIAFKRSEYFAAGTLVVWDVSPKLQAVACFRRTDPDAPVIFRVGDTAEAEPAVPGWTMPVYDVFNPPAVIRRP